MKLALVIDRIEPFYRGGYERRAWELARRLARSNDVTVFTSAPASTTIDGVKIDAVRPLVPYFKADGFRDLRANLLFAMALCRSLRHRRDFDIVDCNATPFVQVYPAALLARRWGAVLVVTAHEALANTMRDYFHRRGAPLASVAAWTATMIYHQTQRMPACLIAPSLVTADELRREGYTKVQGCVGGVSEVHAAKDWSSGRVIFVGRLVPDKKVDVLLAAFARARAGQRIRTLTVVGDGPERGRLERLAGELGIADAVHFAGDVSDQVKTDQLRGADLFVSASPREGISIAVLEALAAGTPAVVSHRQGENQNGALEYIIDGVNGAVTDGGVASLAGAMHRLADPAGYAHLSHSAVATAARYSWDTAARDLQGIYQSVLHEQLEVLTRGRSES